MNFRPLIAIVAVAAAGCGAVPQRADQGYVQLPEQGFKSLVDAPREDPWKRVREIDTDFRDTPWNYTENHQGLDRLRYPTTSNLHAAWMYVLAARDFRAQDERGAAAQAYWTALALAGRAFASRADREFIRRTAYRELADLSTQRSEPAWAAVLGLCADLSDAYLASPQAQADDASFYTELARVRREGERVASLRSSLESKKSMDTFRTSMGLVAAFAQAVSDGMNGNTNSTQAQDLAKQTLERSAEEEKEIRALQDEYDSSIGRLTQRTRSFRSVVAEDVSEVAAGKSFLADEVAYYLGAAKDATPYRQVLQRFAVDKPSLAAALAGNAVDTARLTHELQQVEIAAIRERIAAARK